MYKILVMLLICSASFCDEIEDRLIEIQSLYDKAFSEIEHSYCTCGLNPDCEAIDFAYLLGKKQCMSDLIAEYKQFKLQE
tara:strand:- start:844 stop:1083 length:240 start_codon:yes stop_codon:yes gene_type:complete